VRIEELINLEVDLYVQYCRAAAKHDEWEEHNRMVAHTLFYHIQEMRSTGREGPSIKFIRDKIIKPGPIS
jgi:hypothetical protein